MKQKLKSKRGITLIALVITIIVLLILAGISIAMLTGDNGLLTKASTAKTLTQKANWEEQIKLSVMTARMGENAIGKINETILEEELAKAGIAADMIEKQGEDGALPWIISVDGYKFQIQEDGTVEAIDGISLSSTNLKMAAGQDPVKLTTTLTEGLTGTVVWSSSDESVAKVNNGEVTAVGTSGTAVITAKVSGTDYSATCNVTIVSKVTAINVENIEVAQGESGKLTVTTTPSGNMEDLEYTSSDTSVATVDKDGNVSVAESAEIGKTVTITVKGTISGKTATCTVTVVESKPLQIGDYVEYNVTYTGMYSDTDLDTEGEQGYEFTALDGWRVLDPGTYNETTKTATGVKLISTGVPAKLYYVPHLIKTFVKDGKHGMWAGDDKQRPAYASELGITDSSKNDNNNMYAAAGLYYNFGKIKFSKGTTSSANEGYYTQVNGKTEGNLAEDEFIVEGKASKVHNLTLAELNKARNESNLQSTGSVSTNSGAPGLFYLRGLGSKYGYAYYTNPNYWLAFPDADATYCLWYVNSNGNIKIYDNATYGVRPVVSLTSEVYKENGVWKIR